MKITKKNSVKFDWGQNCQGWHFINTQELRIIQEMMPNNTK